MSTDSFLYFIYVCSKIYLVGYTLTGSGFNPARAISVRCPLIQGLSVLEVKKSLLIFLRIFVNFSY